MTHDPITDFFNRIRNAQAVGKTTVEIPASKLKESIARVLKDTGYIAGVNRIEAKPSDTLELHLKYEGKKPAITQMRRLSKPGGRRYSGADHFPRPLSGYGLVIVSTPKGVMSGRDAEKAGLGGELIATVW